MIIYKDMNKEYIEVVVILTVKEYEVECEKCRDLIQIDVRDRLRGLIEELD